jgi:hypothetical protein
MQVRTLVKQRKELELMSESADELDLKAYQRFAALSQLIKVSVFMMIYHLYYCLHSTISIDYVLYLAG